MDAKGFHHFYIGMDLIWLAFYLLVFEQIEIISDVMLSIGIVLCADDWYQHWRQLKQPEYRSPLHKLYGYFYARFGFLRWLNKIADRIFS